MKQSKMSKGYVLITAARNEETYLGKTIEAILNQTILPKQWVIVSDGSIDRTDEIARKASEKKGFIKFIKKELGENQTGFASKVYALNLGLKLIADYDYEFIGHLDADVTFDPDYYECVIKEFLKNPRLGITGGFIFELDGHQFKSRPSNSVESVAGAIQLFRRECYDDIGGFVPIAIGGEDWYAEIVSRMKGWQVSAIPELEVLHHKRSTKARGIFKEYFRRGVVDYSFGAHPLFEVAKGIRRIREKPYFVSALVLMAGFLSSYFIKRDRIVSIEIINYLRQEQLGRLRSKLLKT
jgi:poly-beta-1,6-N-acetyl-D-glucosamine synthase